jgi:serine/threonine protein kinase
LNGPVKSGKLAKLCDFGLGKMMEENYYTVSTPGVPIPLKWTAPEALEKKQFSEKSDVWSFHLPKSRKGPEL